ncbi:hypothetical protein G7046_g4837 [Stylonectria norvegica]|nr:hypothetical protein G7046_g4837 [Stylonectria norvegica]
MLPIRAALSRRAPHISSISPRLSSATSLARLLRKCPLQQRCYAQPAKPSRVEEELKRQVRAAAKSGKKFEVPERLIIYHAGTGRTTFLAMIKITTLFMGAFFCFLVVPGYYKAEKAEWETVGVALCGIVPILFVAYTTSSFVTHIHIHLPAHARLSRAILERFVHALPASTPLTLTTMSFIAKPRYSNLQAGDLVSARRRFGLVNYVRDTAGENARRRWYNFRAVARFYVQEKKPERRVRYERKKKDLVDGWIWEAVKERVAKKARAGSS